MTPDANLLYAIFWTVYAISFAIFFVLLTRAMRSWPYWLKTLIQSVLIVILLTPVQSTEAVNWWIPAWLHGGYEFILGNVDEMNRAVRNVSLAGGVMLVVWILDLLRAKIWNGRRKDKDDNDDE